MKKHLLFFLFFSGLAIFLVACGKDNSTNPVEPVHNPPVITSIDPTIVFPNDIMSIRGKNFKDERGASKVYFNDLLVDYYISWSDKEIKVVVPAITGSGKVKVVVNDTASNEFDYIYDTNPRIFSAVGAGVGVANVGDVVSITGVNFGNTQGTVTFNQTAATKINSWNDSLIKVVVPTGATSGDLLVTTSDGKSSKPFYFTIMTPNDPYIQTVVPGQFYVGDTLIIKGENFGSTRGTSAVHFNSLQASSSDYILWSDKLINVKCPVGAVSGKLQVRVGTQGSNYVDYVVLVPLPDPIITSLSKTSFEIGEKITIYGSNFTSDFTELTYVDFNGVKATNYINWSDTQIQVEVPSGAQNGKLHVVVDGRISNGIDYTIVLNTTPQITNIIPATAAPGQEVSIKGKNFGSSKGNSRVLFGTTEVVTYLEWTDTQIGVKVPATGSSGEVKVVVEVNSVKSNEIPFTILAQAQPIVDMVEIPAGTFMMGCGDETMDCFPKHQVTLTKNFYVSKYEISQKQYKKVMNLSNPSRIVDDNNPVERVTWLQAIDFCNRLSKLEGYEEVYTVNGTTVTMNKNANGYRLLTEAEWEYAARARCNGKNGNIGGAEALISQIAWTSTDGVDKPQHIGQKQPNDFGLYDMQGNVGEWVWDYFDFYDENATPLTDPIGPDDGIDRVSRGGSYQDGPDNCAVYSRSSGSPQVSFFYVGFRIARNK